MKAQCAKASARKIRARGFSDVAVLITMMVVLVLSATITLLSIRASRPLVPLTPPVSPFGYTASLALFVVPGLVLTVWSFKWRNVLQRRAFVRTILFLFVCGVGLDIFFGWSFFTFPNTKAVCGPTFPGVCFGFDEFRSADFKNFPGFAAGFAPHPTNSVSAFIYQHLSEETRTLLTNAPESLEAERLVLTDLNALARREDLSRNPVFSATNVATGKIPEPQKAEDGAALFRRNVRLIASAYPAFIEKQYTTKFKPGIPFEEFGFYFFGIATILLVYVWGDEVWFGLYNRSDCPRKDIRKIFHWHWWSFSTAAALLVGSIIAKKFLFKEWSPGFPGYFWFLTIVGLFPSMLFLPTAKPFINWRAFSLAVMFILFVSLLWEAALAVPYQWWGYQPEEMVGVLIYGLSGLPIEEPILWMSVTWAVVIIYETLYCLLKMGPDCAVSALPQRLKKAPIKKAVHRFVKMEGRVW